MKIGYYAVIPTRNRADCLHEAVESLRANTFAAPSIVVVNNGNTVQECDVLQVYEFSDPPNISHLWNRGLDEVADIARRREEDEWFVAVINDDVVLPERWFDNVVLDMQACHADLGCSDQHGMLRQHYVSVSVSEYTLHTRVCGYAFVLRGCSNLRFDEDLAWWYSDDDMDWRARMAGGLSITAGLPVHHKYPNAQTNDRPELVEQIGRDRAAFIQKWGRAPW